MDEFNLDDDLSIPSFFDKQPKQPSTSIKNLSGSWRSYDGHYITIIKIKKNTYRIFHNDFNKTIHDLTFDGKDKFISSDNSAEATLSNNTLHFNTMDRKKKVKWYFIDHTYPKPVNISGLYQFSNSSELIDIVRLPTNKKNKKNKTYDYLFVAYYSKINEAANAANKATAVANAVALMAAKLVPKPITETVDVGPIYSNNEAATKVNNFIKHNPKYHGWVFTSAWHSNKGTSYAELRNENKVNPNPINTKPLSIDKTELFYVCDNMIFSEVHGSGIIFNNQIIWKSSKNYWKKVFYPVKSDISGLWKSDTGHSIYIIRKNFNEHIIMHDNKNKTIETCTYIDVIKRNADDNDLYTLLEQVISSRKSKDKQQIEYVRMQINEMKKKPEIFKRLENIMNTRNSFYLSSRAIGGPGEFRKNQTYLVDNELRYNNIIWKKISNSFPKIPDISGKWKSKHADIKIYKNQLNPYIYDYSFRNFGSNRDHYGHIYMNDQFVYFIVGNHREIGFIQNNNTRLSLQQGKVFWDKIK